MWVITVLVSRTELKMGDRYSCHSEPIQALPSHHYDTRPNLPRCQLREPWQFPDTAGFCGQRLTPDMEVEIIRL